MRKTPKLPKLSCFRLKGGILFCFVSHCFRLKGGILFCFLSHHITLQESGSPQLLILPSSLRMHEFGTAVASQRKRTNCLGGYRDAGSQRGLEKVGEKAFCCRELFRCGIAKNPRSPFFILTSTERVRFLPPHKLGRISQ